MAENNLAVLSCPQLFQLCAAYPHHEEYWPEFVHRFNPLLVRSIVTAWRKSGQGDCPPADLASDLLQDVYITIVKNDFRLLRNFRGGSTAEAQAYLAHTAINRTFSFLRARQALRRSMREVSLQALLEEEGEIKIERQASSAANGLAESELLAILEKCFDGPNCKRDIFLFLLYIRDGYSASEIASLEVVKLKETSIANLLGKMKARLKKYLIDPV